MKPDVIKMHDGVNVAVVGKKQAFKEEADILAFLLHLLHQFNDFPGRVNQLHIPGHLEHGKPFLVRFLNYRLRDFRYVLGIEQEDDAG